MAESPVKTPTRISAKKCKKNIMFLLYGKNLNTISIHHIILTAKNLHFVQWLSFLIVKPSSKFELLSHFVIFWTVSTSFQGQIWPIHSSDWPGISIEVSIGFFSFYSLTVCMKWFNQSLSQVLTGCFLFCADISWWAEQVPRWSRNLERGKANTLMFLLNRSFY